MSPTRREAGCAGGTLVLFIGNPIVQNDQIGLIVGERIEALFSSRADVQVREFIGSPLDLIGEIEGYDTAILVDSIATGSDPTGTVRLFSEEQLCGRAGDAYPHGLGLPQAIAAARRLDLPIPRQISLIGIEVGPITTFGESLSAELGAKMDDICGQALEIAGRLVPSGGR